MNLFLRKNFQVFSSVFLQYADIFWVPKLMVRQGRMSWIFLSIFLISVFHESLDKHNRDCLLFIGSGIGRLYGMEYLGNRLELEKIKEKTGERLEKFDEWGAI